MADKETELWARADQLASWGKQLQDMQDRMAALVAQLGDMSCFRVSRATVSTADHTPPADDPAQPPPLPRRKIQAAAKYWANSLSMPPWLPICSKADADAVVRKGRKLVAAMEKKVAKARGTAAPKAKPAAKAAPAPAAAEAKPATQAWPAPTPPTEAEKRKRMRTGLKRISFRMRFDQLAKEHGNEVATYAVTHLCGTLRTATALSQAMEGYLGTFDTPAAAGSAFAKAQGQTVNTEGQAFAALARARNQLELEDKRVAIWRHHVAPGDVGAAKGAA